MSRADYDVQINIETDAIRLRTKSRVEICRRADYGIEMKVEAGASRADEKE